MRKESGTCNVCSTPCSSCMHRITDVSESNIKHNCKREEASSCSFNCANNKSCYGAQHVASEASNFLSASSSQNPYSCNIESQSVMRSSVAYETSEAVDMPLKFSTLEKVGKNQQFQGKSSRSLSELQHSAMNDEQYDEFHGDIGSGDCSNLLVDSDADLRKNMLTACALKYIPGSKTAKKLTHIKESYDCTASKVVLGKNSWCANSKVLPGIMLSKVNEEPMESMVGVVKPYCTGPLTGVCVTENPILLNAEAEQTGQIRNDLSSQACENGCDFVRKAVKADEIARCNESNEQLEKNISVLEESNEKGYQIHVQPCSMAEAPISDSGIGLIDVNVCDICGDVGREALLATCSRCADGAEHIYCMRVKLNKVPKDDWLCEQCEMKERAEKNKNYDATSMSDYSEGNTKMNLKSASSPRPTNSTNLGAKTAGSKACESLNVRQNSFKLRRHIMSAGTTPAVIKELSEMSNDLMLSPSRGKSPAFSHSNSFKQMEMIKSKPMSSVSSSRVQPKSSLQTLSRTHAIGSISLKARKDLCPPKVLSKQVSFDVSKIRKQDKLLVEGHAQKRARKSTSNDITDAPVKSIAKSASLKIVNSGSPRAELMNKALGHKSFRFKDNDTLVDKIQPLKSPRLEGQTCIRPIKEKNKSGRQDGTFPGRSVINLSQMDRIRSSKVEQSITPFDKKLHNRVDPAALSTSKTSNDAKNSRYEEGKVQNSSSTRCITSENKLPNINATIAAEGSSNTNIYTNQSKIDIEKGLGKAATKTLHLTGTAYAGYKSKNSSASSPKKTMIPCVELGIHEGNDASHTKKNCAAQKLTDVAEGTTKGGRLKDAFQAVLQKNKMNKNSRLLEQTEKCSMACNNTTRDVTIASSLIHPKCQENSPSKDDCESLLKLTDPISNSSKTEVDFAMKQTKDLVAASGLSGLASLDTTDANPDKLHLNISRQPVPAQPSVACKVAVPVVPQHEFIWQGAFEILTEGNSPKFADGIQAHLASSVSPNVLELVRHIPSIIQLEEVPRASIWPVQFQETSPTEESIALYFFAKDTHSYETYQKLLDCVLRNDMALRGIINEVELLIFTSNKLPDNSQYWNQLLFLWGVFRATENSSSPPNLHGELRSSKLSRDIFSSPTCEALILQKIDSDDNIDDANVRSNKIPESKPIEENSSGIVKLEKAAHASEAQLYAPLSKCLNASTGLEEGSYQEETRLKEVSVKPETVLDEPNAEKYHPIWPLKPNSKHSYSCLSASDKEAAEVFTRSVSWHEKHACISEDDKKVVKIKCHDEGHEVNSHLDQAVARHHSTKVFHLFGNVVEQMQKNDVYYENKPYDTKDLRLIDTDILKGNTHSSLTRISLEVEESSNADSPDLELSLGAPRRLSKVGTPPLLLPVAGRSSDVSSGSLAVDEENVTLSLASPGTGRVISRNSTLRTEQLFPEDSFFETCVPLRSFAFT